MRPSPQDSRNSPGSEWASQTTDTIDALVGVVRDRATVPVRTAARAIVYGIALSVVGVVILALLTAGSIRGMTLALTPLVGHSSGHHHRVWVTYVILGGIFTIAGVFLLRKAEATPQEDK